MQADPHPWLSVDGPHIPSHPIMLQNSRWEIVWPQQPTPMGELEVQTR